jgi:hypothetical protein
MERTCASCGEIFTPTEDHVNDTTCSLECAILDAYENPAAAVDPFRLDRGF